MYGYRVLAMKWCPVQVRPYQALWLAVVLLSVWNPTPVLAQTVEPLATQFVKCVSDANGQAVASRRVQTPVFTSKVGGKAYGLVNAMCVHLGTCINSSSVYVAEPQGPFKQILQLGAERQVDGTVDEGNGIDTLRWSPSGQRLLIELSQWTWGSDAGVDTKYAVFTVGGLAAQLIVPDGKIREQFQQPCQLSIKAKGWADDSQIEFEVNPSHETGVEGNPNPTPSCVEEPKRFDFDVVTEALVTKPNLELRLAPGKLGKGLPGEFSFVFVNISDHQLRMPRPTQCSGGNGTVLLRSQFKPLNPRRVPSGGGGGCGAGHSAQQPIERAKSWQLLKPGESLAVHYSRRELFDFQEDSGSYEFWGEYLPPQLSSEDVALVESEGFGWPRTPLASTHLHFKRPQ